MSILMIPSVENATSSNINKKNSSSGILSNDVLAKTIPTPTKATTNVVEVGHAAVTSPQPIADQFDIVLFTQEYVQQVAVALSVVFAQEEPLCIATRTNPINFFAYSLVYAQQCCDGKLSMLAIDRNSKMVVGFHLCHDYETWVEPHSDDPGVTVQGELLERLHEVFHANEKAIQEEPESPFESHGSPRTSFDGIKSGEKKKKTMKVCSAGVFAFARRMRLATRMLEKNLEYAKQLGYNEVLVECTGAYSQQLYKSYGFNEKARIYYNEYEVEVLAEDKKVKVKPFITIPKPHEFINLSILDL
ncbi:hypothetical protein NAEGRDRAFT_79614 [Naegleria gruberi]|uniref:Uncharacterized protein n=1 Tax=Naegleria gruberi TaxID=5762 RepID=D2VE57_NAEGR|nr:uncharacterized protein NAEGRDRAFT_79614 [Naegleria gruberi]EFC44737.1 hypothetical protein NAEGRDRAFT_79614 [Naegleria gruberi]|eukprot:XP_002677481.1 hypothetical protein NAEGRDRAFT_79614 [Naegleria gruberi strain NEG-M]